MLTRLEIKSFAVIEHAVFCPGKGLNVISGETGAGKSLLIDAIGLIFGEKASKNLIRNDSTSASVEAVFELCGNTCERVAPLMDELGIPFDEGTIVISRTFREEGKSIARINGTTVVLSQLKKISRELIDIHGQNDNSRIFDPSVHIDMLDSFGGKEIKDKLSEYRKELQTYKDLTVKYKEVSKLAATPSSTIEYLTYAIKQIDEAELKPGEDESLTIRKKELSAASRYQSLINDASVLIYGSDSTGATSSGRLNEALKIVKRLEQTDPSFAEYASRLETLSLELESFSFDFSKKVSEYGYSEEEARQVNNRLSLIFELESKYGKTIEDVISFADTSRKELSDIEEAGKNAAELKKRLRDAEADLLKVATELSDIRKKSAEQLSSLITEELKDLQMPSSSFYVNFDRRSKERFFNLNGIDDVKFMFSANPGHPPMELASTASGGEASRIMLAIKKILSSADTMPTLIFDEIDTGVSGLASLSIARKLKSISVDHQVLCVTHTAQLAAASDNSFLIKKNTDGLNTYTEITPLDEEGRINEVSRLLSGNDDEESLRLARKMIDELRT